MPICYIDAPPGISPRAKKRMMERITAAIEEGYNKIGDTFVFLREDKLENVMVNGRTAADNPKYGGRLQVFLFAPPANDRNDQG
jgi:phenylpyruvate tautomerase PptA (4-oxalocrotonate tautomerase family)